MIRPRDGLIALSILLLMVVSVDASASGKSVEDLVGIFSLEKTIKLGSGGNCFRSQEARDSLGQASILADKLAPGLAGFDFEPKKIDESNDFIDFKEHIIDDQSGLYLSAAWFQSPSGDQKADVLIFPQNLTSGDTKDGVYDARIALPGEAEKGEWRLKNLTLIDSEGNRRVYHREEILRMGLPAGFQVI